jgi:hypothetical protein
MKITRRQLRRLIREEIKRSHMRNSLINEGFMANRAKDIMRSKIKEAFDNAGYDGDHYADQLVSSMEAVGFDRKLDYGTKSPMRLISDTETAKRLEDGPLDFHPSEIVEGTKDLKAVGDEVVAILMDAGYMGEPPAGFDADGNMYQDHPEDIPDEEEYERVRKFASAKEKESDLVAAWEALSFIVVSWLENAWEETKLLFRQMGAQQQSQFDYVDSARRSGQGHGLSRWR